MKEYLSLLLLFAFLLLLSSSTDARNQARLTLDSSGGYRDLVVAIDRSWPENEGLIPNLKTMLQDFSDQLHTATKPMFTNGGSLTLRHVYILLPSTWNAIGRDEDATWQTFENADVRLGRLPGTLHYAHHGGLCRTFGDYVLFDVDHVMNTTGYRLGKQLLAEFARYRWGLKSEHNGETGPHFYLEDNQIRPAVCIHNMQGAFRHNVTQQACKVDRNTIELEPNCRFYPDQTQPQATASLLTTTSVLGIEHFCDGSAQALAETEHSRWAPVPLNHITCGRTWGARRVMLRSDSRDFIYPPQPQQSPPPVQFRVVRPLQHRRLVLVIDVSGSMRGHPLEKTKTAFGRLIMDQLEDGIELAIIVFNSNVIVLKEMGLLSSQVTRAEYYDGVQRLGASGASAIGDALAKAMELLGVNLQSPAASDAGSILILSDGEENIHLRYTLQQAGAILRNTSIRLDTVRLGSLAGMKVAQLSASTEGISVFARTTGPSYSNANDMVEQLAKMVADRVRASQAPITIFSSVIQEMPFAVSVFIDSSVGVSTSFMLSVFSAGEIRNLDVEVVSPTGLVYDSKNSTIYQKDEALGTIIVRLPGQAETGHWTVRSVTSQPRQASFSTKAALLVMAKPVPQEDPLTLQGSVHSDLEINVTESTRITITGSLFRGNQPLRGANIRAVLESESQLAYLELPLQDAGWFPDMVANDGIYSALVPRYILTAGLNYNVRLISESPVRRVSNAGHFFVTLVDQNSLQNLWPFPITDLKASVDLSSQTVELQWTAMSEGIGQGKVSKYLIRASRNASVLERNFNWADEISTLVTPLEPGSVQVEKLNSSQLPSYTNTTFYLGVKSLSSANVESIVSNLVATQLQLPDNIDSIEGTATTTTDSRSTTSAKDGTGSTGESTVFTGSNTVHTTTDGSGSTIMPTSVTTGGSTSLTTTTSGGSQVNPVRGSVIMVVAVGVLAICSAAN